MAFADPQEVSLNGEDVSLPRVAFGDNSGAFLSETGLEKLSFSHTYKKRVRRVVRFDVSRTVADPLVSGLALPASMSVYLVADVPKVGFDSDMQKAVVGALVGYLAADTGANIGSFVGGQS